VVLTRALRYFV